MLVELEMPTIVPHTLTFYNESNFRSVLLVHTFSDVDSGFYSGSSCLRHELRVLISLLYFLISQVPRRGFSDDHCIDGRHNAEDTETTSLLFFDLKIVLHLRLQLNYWKGEGQRTKEMNHI